MGLGNLRRRRYVPFIFFEMGCLCISFLCFSPLVFSSSLCKFFGVCVRLCSCKTLSLFPFSPPHLTSLILNSLLTPSLPHNPSPASVYISTHQSFYSSSNNFLPLAKARTSASKNIRTYYLIRILLLSRYPAFTYFPFLLVSPFSPYIIAEASNLAIFPTHNFLLFHHPI